MNSDFKNAVNKAVAANDLADDFEINQKIKIESFLDLNKLIKKEFYSDGVKYELYDIINTICQDKKILSYEHYLKLWSIYDKNIISKLSETII